MRRAAYVVLAACAGAPPALPAPPPAIAPAPPPVTIAPPACNDAETCHHEAEDREADGDFAAAATAYERACAFGEQAACFAAGVTLRGRVEPPELVRSHAAFAKACELGVADGCAQVGTDLLTGTGVAADRARGATQLTSACTAGSGLACYNLGVLARDAKDPATAYGRFHAACVAGSASGCVEEGLAAVRGEGTRKDLAHARARYEEACRLSAKTCVFLGELAQRDKQHARARTLYDQACGAGSAPACHNLGVMHDRGIGARPDGKRAAELFAKACELGLATDCGAR